MALDLSTRKMGWAVDAGNAPRYGLVRLPGMKDLGVLYVAVRNALEKLIEEHEPDKFIFCLARFHDAQTAARALNGVQAMAEFVATDLGLTCEEAVESRVRKVVLGRGSFGGKDPLTGGLIPGLGSKQAKQAALAWCAEQGYEPASDDVADALVLLEYHRRLCLDPKIAETPARRRAGHRP